MQVIIIGAGKVGYNIAQILSNENHDVVVIEQIEERCRIIEESLELLLTKELENDLAFSLAKNKISVYHNQEKLAGFLYRRGFNTEIIYQIISTIYIDNDSK